MGVYIKRMEMPTSCYDCNCFIRDSDGSDYCCLLMQDIEDNNKRDDNCPLVPVPPHGDLIDRGYAIAIACSGRIRTLPTTEDGENWIRVDEVRESIKSAPTIIPAEEGE